MNCIAIDDEPLALNIIKDFCSRIDFLNLLGSYTNAMDALKILHQQDVDLIFLDIHMPHLSGLDFIKTLVNPPLIIFTTAYSEHALQGFELNAIDYLVKPIPFERFFKAVNKAYELINLRNKNIQTGIHNHTTLNQADYIMIKVEYSTIKVTFDEILFIEGLKDYVKIHRVGKSLLTKSTMKNIEDKLPSNLFIRVHKSFIVPISKINKIENNRIIIGDKRIPVGDHYKEAFYNLLNKYRL